MGGKSDSGPQTTTSTVEPSTIVRPYIQAAMPGLADIFATRLGAQYGPGPSAVAGFNPLQSLAQQGTLDFATSDALNRGLASTGGALDYGLNLPQNLANDPVVGGHVAAAQQDVIDQFKNQIMPTIGARSLGSGTFGGSRQGVAEGLAAQGLTRELGDISASMRGNVLSDALENQQRALAMAPQTMQMGLMPSQLIGGVGSELQGLESQLLGEQRGDYQYMQSLNDPMNLYTNYLNMLTAPGFGSSGTQTAPNPNASSTAGRMIGGALLGSQVPGMFGAYASAAGPTMAPMLAGMGPLGWAGLGAMGLGLFG